LRAQASDTRDKSAAESIPAQHKERHPVTGLIHRTNVYYLDNGYWNCYREDELRTLNQSL
jgi:hypothetical protein